MGGKDGGDSLGPLHDDDDRLDPPNDDASDLRLKSLCLSSEEFDNLSGRKFRLGEFVASLSDKDKLGQIVTVNRSYGIVDIEDNLLRDILPDQLQCITKFAEGDLVLLTDWLGRVNFVSRDVTVMFKKDGVERTFKGGRGFRPSSPDWDIGGADFPLHPGQEVSASGTRCIVTKESDVSVFVD